MSQNVDRVVIPGHLHSDSKPHKNRIRFSSEEPWHSEDPNSGCKIQPPTRSPQQVLAMLWYIKNFFYELPELEILQDTHSPAVIALQEFHQVTTERVNSTLRDSYPGDLNTDLPINVVRIRKVLQKIAKPKLALR